MPGQLKIDQIGLSAGVAGVSRTDGLATGALVTLTIVGSEGVNEIRLLWGPPDDTTAESSLSVTGDPAVWTFSPTAGTYGTYLIQLLEDGLVVDERILGVRTPNKGLLIPALNERASKTASWANDGADQVDISRNNANDFTDPVLNDYRYAGWWRSQHELYKAVDALESGAPTDAEYVLGAPDGDLPNGRVATASTEITPDVGTPNVISWALNTASVALAKLANLTGLSVLGRAANSAGVMAAITASAARQTLGVNDAGTALAWGDPVEIRDSGADQGDVYALDFVAGANVNIAASVAGRVATITPSVDFSSLTGLQFVTYGAEATLTNERVLTSSTSIGISIATAGQIRPERAALTGEVLAGNNDNATTIARGTNFSTSPWTGNHTFNGSFHTIDVTGAVNIDADAASRFVTSVGDLTLQTTQASTRVIVSGRDDVLIEAVDDDVFVNAFDLIQLSGTGAGGRISMRSGGSVTDRFVLSAAGDITLDVGSQHFASGFLSFAGPNALPGTGQIRMGADAGSNPLRINAGSSGAIALEGGAMSWSGGQFFLANTNCQLRGSVNAVQIEGTSPFLVFDEVASSSATVSAGHGMFWVRNDAPSVPMFTDDTNVDHEILLGKLIARTVLTSGTGATFNHATGAKTCIIKGVGGGGAGGGAAAAAGSGGACGGSATYGERRFTIAASTSTYTVGAAGAGSSGAAGGAGTSSTWTHNGTTTTLPNGSGGAVLAGGTGLARQSGPSGGGAATNADVSIPGQNGGDVARMLAGASSPMLHSQGGGSTPLGQGGIARVATAGNIGGVAATGFGSGGSGFLNGTSSAANAGSNGAPGVWIVEEYS